jgi:hypothetical protein
MAEAAGLELSTLAAAAGTDTLAMPQRTLPTNATGNPKLSTQRSLRCAEGFAYTDPDSHILKGADGWIQGYNAQAAVDGDHQVIVAIGVSNQPSDAVHLLPMLERIEANTGQLPAALITDAGYCSTSNLEACGDRGLQTYISTSRQQHRQRPRPSRGRPTRDLNARGRLNRELRSKAGQAIFGLRRTVVEPVFGQIKGARRMDRFRLRGQEQVNGGWALMAPQPTTSTSCSGHHWQQAEGLVSQSFDLVSLNHRGSVTASRTRVNVQQAPRRTRDRQLNFQGGQADTQDARRSGGGGDDPRCHDHPSRYSTRT